MLDPETPVASAPRRYRPEEGRGRRTPYRTYAEVQQAGADIYQSADGTWWRDTVGNVLDVRDLPDGRRQAFRARVPRRVGLSLEECRASLEPLDYWDTWTWIRNGRKPEGEYPENLGTAASADGEWEDVAPATVSPARVRPPRPAPTPSGQGGALSAEPTPPNRKEA
jgi:hypothetical protein